MVTNSNEITCMNVYVWWPGMDTDIEKLVWGCSECQAIQSSPPAAPLHPWKWPTRPRARFHLDFAGQFLRKMFLVLIDAHSKYTEVFCTSTATSAVVIEELRSGFGSPETMVTDNGSSFVSAEFEKFLQTKMGLSISPLHLIILPQMVSLSEQYRVLSVV